MTGDIGVMLTVMGAAAATYALRFGGLLLSDRIPKTTGFTAFMGALPGTILFALVIPGVFNAGPWGWVAAAATALCAYKSGNLFLSMGLGMVIMALQRNLWV